MGKGIHLGEFEQVVMLALARLGERGSGRAVYEEILEQTGRDVSIAAVYVTLSRLEAKGYVASELGEPRPERGGKAKKYFCLETAGAQALKRSRNLLDQLWEGARLHPHLRKG